MIRRKVTVKSVRESDPWEGNRGKVTVKKSPVDFFL
jgi:hypothetical protein